MVEKWGPRYKYHKGKDELAYLAGFNDGLIRANEVVKKQLKSKQWKH